MSSTLTCRGARIALLSAALAGVAMLAAAPAQAGTTSAACSVTFPFVAISPPFMPFVLAPASGTVSSGGQTGTVSCAGEIGGDWVLGAGTAGLQYAYSRGSCAAHVGLGNVTWIIPTTAGPKQLTGTLSVRRIGLGILADVQFPDAHAYVTGALVPLEGDCVLSPLREVRVTVAGLLVGT